MCSLPDIIMHILTLCVYVCVSGGVPEGSEMLNQKFDHIMFTGGTVSVL